MLIHKQLIHSILLCRVYFSLPQVYKKITCVSFPFSRNFSRERFSPQNTAWIVQFIERELI